MLVCVVVFGAVATAVAAAPSVGGLGAPDSWVQFDSFDYRGEDAAARSVGKDQYLNPILAGFYPDPSICRVGSDYYLVNSSFTYFPGIPIFHSTDLVSWRQLGSVLDRPEQFDTLKDAGVSRGIYAPTIRYHDGTFYLVCTFVNGGGNFYVTATNPAGAWSELHWLKDLEGIDPSLFFDDDGHAYMLSCSSPPDNKPLYDGHRTIRIREFDLKAGAMTGPEKILINGGTDISKHPVWIEGPHMFKRGAHYYLICAEGGTGGNHSEVVFRGDSVWGPFVPFAGNPILTQRQLPGDRTDPVTCTGHADFVETQSGQWWAVFLGCRPYDTHLFNTGRETFMLPVRWENDWPIILGGDDVVPRVVKRPDLPPAAESPGPLNGTFECREDFSVGHLSPEWMMLRKPEERWYSLSSNPGHLMIAPRAVALDSMGNPSFIGRRQQHAHFEATTAITVNPRTAAADAGLVAFQDEQHYLFLGMRISDGAGQEVFLEQFAGPDAAETIAHAPLPAGTRHIDLKILGRGRDYSFSFRTGSGDWTDLKKDVDGSILSTDVAGGFQGVVLGMYARTPQ